jgi:hypothetical protein
MHDSETLLLETNICALSATELGSHTPYVTMWLRPGQLLRTNRCFRGCLGDMVTTNNRIDSWRAPWLP